MPSFHYEVQAEAQHAGPRGRLCVAGLDEVGRGPLAGPVVAAAAVIDRQGVEPGLLRLIDDSKKLTRKGRERAYEAMMAAGCVRFAIGEASVEEIDRLNILQASFIAMRRALVGLGDAPPDIALVDGNRVPPALGCTGQAIVAGDAQSYSIAAASIFAKVTRDRTMCQLAQSFPGYGWERNAGYGSAAHVRALNTQGPTPHHRRSFAPVRACLDRRAAEVQAIGDRKND
jgi:ribonuclease HII